jgi:hypothetical protein
MASVRTVWDGRAGSPGMLPGRRRLEGTNAIDGINQSISVNVRLESLLSSLLHVLDALDL